MKMNNNYWLAILFLIASCGNNGGGDEQEPEFVCMPDLGGPQQLKYTDVTNELVNVSGGLTGGNITVADVNGDGYPDFVVTAGNNEVNSSDNYSNYRLMINDSGKGFKDGTKESGLFTADDGSWLPATFVVFADVDNDGDQDALVVVNSSEGDESPYNTRLCLNDGHGVFKPFGGVQFGSGIQPAISAAVSDFDHDGLLDIFIANHYAKYGYLNKAKADQLYYNNGNGVFENVTKIVGLELSGFTEAKMSAGLNPKPSWGVAACDLNDDGYDDLLVSAYGRQFNDLFINNFKETDGFIHSGIANGVAADSNLDYSDNLFYICYCSVHSDEAVCADAYSVDAANCAGMTDYWAVGSDDQPYRLGGNSSNMLCGDLDGDGDIDLVSLELRHEHIGKSSDATEILINEGFPTKPFTRPGNEKTGLTRIYTDKNNYFNEGDLAGAIVDLDNDGRLDIVVASSDYGDTWFLVWQQQADGTFKEVAESAGLRLPRAHGLGLIDYDLDGDYDLIIGTSLMRWAKSDTPAAPDAPYVHIMRNDSAPGNQLRLQLVGGGDGQANRDAIGAKVTVKTNFLELVRLRQGAYGLTGIEHDGTMIIGVGDYCPENGFVEDVTVRWPNKDNKEVHYKGVRLNGPLNVLHEDGKVERRY